MPERETGFQWAGVVLPSIDRKHLLPGSLAAVGLLNFIVFHDLGAMVVNGDGGFFLYTGMRFADGTLPYAEIWDLKPPVMYEVIAVVHLLTLKTPLLTHLIVLFLNIISLGAIAVISASLVFKYTDSEYVSIAAGLFVYTIPEVYTAVISGPNPYLWAAALYLLALFFYESEYPVRAGIFAALAAGTIQSYGMVVVAIGIVYLVFDNRRTLMRFTIGILLTTIVVVLPWVVTGTIGALLNQAVMAALTIQWSEPATARFHKLVFHSRVTWIALFLACSAVVFEIRDRVQPRPRFAMLLILFGMALYSTLFVQFEGQNDIIHLLVTAPLLAGIAINRLIESLDRRQSLMLLGLVLFAIVTNISLVYGDMPPITGDFEMRTLIYQDKIVDKCYVDIDGKSSYWISETPSTEDAEECWNPDIGTWIRYWIL